MQARSKNIQVTREFEPCRIGGDELGFVRMQSGVVLCAYDGRKQSGVVLNLPEVHPEKTASALTSLLGQFKGGLGSLQTKIVGPLHLRQQLKKLLSARGITVQAEAECSVVNAEICFSPLTEKVRIERPAAATVLQKTRVLIVDDSNTIRKLLRQILESDPQFEIVAETGQPTEAEALIEKHRPTLITLDIHMPEMDGITLLKRITARHSIPVVMISSISATEGVQVLKALELGAVDYIEKPKFNEIEQSKPMLLEKLRAAATAKTMKARSAPAVPQTASRFESMLPILIGSSTGGTEALRELLTRLPKDIPPILIVQHIPALFSAALAARLNDLCPFEVREAAQGDAVRPGCVLIAPGGFHMTVRGSLKAATVSLSAEVNGYRHVPAVDVLFDSGARTFGGDCTAVILTGMGRDGADGMLKLKNLGARTVAQDEASCVVYGMPRAAVELGAADTVLPLDQIASALTRAKKTSRDKIKFERR